MTSITDILQQFAPITLEEMEAVKLMNRVDTKYVTSLSQLEQVLRLAAADYYVQVIDGLPVAPYDTLYYDTPTHEMYLHHHDRQLRRQKVRIRTYVQTDTTFLEIKNKNNKGRTKKKRILVSDQHVIAHPSEEVSDFMQKRCWYDWPSLQPCLRTTFKRITLVNRHKTERLTIDTALVWENLQTGIKRTFPDLVIIELKRDGNTSSPMLAIMQTLRIHPLKISKYCVGTALTNPHIKQNRFKLKIRKIQKLLSPL